MAELQPLALIPEMGTLETGGTELFYLFFLFLKSIKATSLVISDRFSRQLRFPISY